MALTKKEQQEKDLKAVLAKDIGAKNPVFDPTTIAELHAMFSLYADPRQRRADIRDILMTAKTLGLDAKQELVYRALHEICDGVGSDALDFEGFLRELTAKIVSINLNPGKPTKRGGKEIDICLVGCVGKGGVEHR